jgi:predicted metalloprotease with PDZ domain
MKSTGLAVFIIGVGASAALLAASAAPAAGPLMQPAPAPLAAPLDRAFPGKLTLAVDASDTQHRVVHVEEHISGVSRQSVLLFPKWLPGNHSHTGPIERLTGLRISSHGAPLGWQRDPLDVYAFHLLPTGAAALTELDVAFDYLSPTEAAIDPVEMSPDLAVLDWNELLLYPAGYYARRIPVSASLKLPAGWQHASALETESTHEDRVQFKATDLETLMDSPIYAGRHAAHFDLNPGGGTPVRMNVFADRPGQLALKDEHLAAYRALVQQAQLLYGSHHYEHYDFLVALSDQIHGKGLEHHQSSEDTVGSGAFSDWDKTAWYRDLLPHEYTHSWNGKFRRPADLWTPNYNLPMQDSLLWVYEGQTEYWGDVLAARSGLWSRQQALDQLALVASYYDLQPGRQWRSLQDTTNDPIINHHRPTTWENWTRYKDYYDEGLLIWLDIDTLIRERSQGRRSLDDFAHAFFSIDDGSRAVVTYTFEDVVRALNQVEPYDWAGLLHQRVSGVGQPAPLDGIRRGGYRLVYSDKPSDFQKDVDSLHKQVNLLHAIGATIDEDGAVSEVVWGKAAYQAGLVAGAQIVAVNGEAYSGERLSDAVSAAKATHQPMALIVRAGSHYRITSIEYYEGLRYPHLERDPAVPARLDDILKARERLRQ